MKKHLLAILIAAFAPWCRVLAYDNTFVVIVGIADYKNNDCAKDLPYTLNNAKTIYNFFRSEEGGSVPKENICLLTDAFATRANIMMESKKLFSKAQKGDRAVFYFGGHGGEGFFCPYDFDGLIETTVFYSDIKEIFRSAKCSTKLLFIDACYSGGIKEPEAIGGKRNIRRTSLGNMNIAVMSASKGDEVSWQSSEFGMGVFTHYLIKGLGGAANRDGNGYITIQELFYYVYKQVTMKTRSSEYDTQQTPQLFGKFDLRLIVAKLTT